MNILIIDNYDSFVYNIVGLLQRERAAGGWDKLEWDVVRNDAISFDSLDRYDAIILSPGPGVPHEAGSLMRLVAEATHIPMLGICLGHQAIAQHYGARLCQLAHLRHGHPSVLTDIDSSDPLIGRCGGATVGRYHSWTVDESSLPSCLRVTSRDEEGHIMSMRHESLPTFGVQFHPESIITTCGRELLHNFIAYAGEWGWVRGYF
ncbi:MAG: aminodeoxychorismate/anthranilate synthase component II [Duncaniella sp.]|nr:aminodeoxychorismate/anthranilate synthase component II [Duncaniella sp.]